MPGGNVNLLHELARIAFELQKVRSEDDIVRTLGQRLFQFHYRCAIYSVDGDSFTIRHLTGKPDYMRNVERALGRPLEGITLPITEEPVRRALATQQPQFTPAFASTSFQDPAVVNIVDRQSAGLSGVYAPIPLEDGRPGVLLVYGENVGPELVDAIGLFASGVASALENARLYEKLQHRVAELTLFGQVSEALIGAFDIEKTLETAAHHLARLVDGSNAFFMIWDEARKKLVGVAASPPQVDEVRQLAIGLDEPSLVARCFRENRPLMVEDTSTGGDFHAGYVARHGQKALLALPLRSRKGTLGVVILGETRGPRRFTDEEINRATALATQIAVAIENARLYEDQRASYEKLSAAQAELLRRERLAALGELSAVVAHEVRNPLGVMFNSISSLRRMLKLEGDPARLLDIVAEEADHLNRLVADLLDFARPSEPALKPAALGEIIDDAIAAAAAEGGPAVKFARDVSPSLPPVPVDRHLLRRALVNVAVNAAQAMPKGGQVTIRAANDERRGEPFARIDVIDEGPGIPEHLTRRVFEPFFTTKATGTGLGLAVVKRIVEDHRGEVSIANRRAPESGATVTLRLPLQRTA